MNLNKYSKEDLIKLAERLENERKYLEKKQEITEKIGNLKVDIRTNGIFSVLLAIDAGMSLWECLYQIQEKGDKSDIITNGVLALVCGGFSGFAFHLYDKKKTEKKLLEEEFNKEEKAFGMTREEFYYMYEKTDHFADSEELDPAIAQFATDEESVNDVDELTDSVQRAVKNSAESSVSNVSSAYVDDNGDLQHTDQPKKLIKKPKKGNGNQQ